MDIVDWMANHLPPMAGVQVEKVSLYWSKLFAMLLLTHLTDAATESAMLLVYSLCFGSFNTQRMSVATQLLRQWCSRGQSRECSSRQASQNNQLTMSVERVVAKRTVWDLP